MNKPKTLADLYLKDGVDVKQFLDDIDSYIKDTDNGYSSFRSLLVGFLNQPLKPTLTEDEKVILRNIDKKIKYITRDKSGYLYITEQSFSMLALPFSIYNHLFQFIKPRRRI